MRNPSFAAAALSLLLVSVSPASAQTEAPAEAPAKPTPEQAANMLRATQILRAFNVALESTDVSQPVKVRLINCLYNNKLSTISAAAGNTLKQNASGSEPTPTDVYRAAAGVCGITFQPTADNAPAAAADDAGDAGR